MTKFNLSDDRVLLAFVDKMVTDKNPDVDEVTRVALRAELKYQLEERIERAIVMALPDQQLVELDQLLEEDASDEEVIELFENSGVDFEMAVNREMKAFREAYLRGEIEVDISGLMARMPQTLYKAGEEE